MKNIRYLIKKPSITISLVLIVLIVISIFYFTRAKKPVYEFAIAKRADIVQEVSVTGQVKPAKRLDLAFEKSGKIAGVSARIDNRVRAGQTLVFLDSAEFVAQLMVAEANLEAEQAYLAELEKGTRFEELQVQQTKVENSKISLEESKKNLINSLNEAYTKSDEAVRIKTSTIFKGNRFSSYSLTFTSCDSQATADAEWLRFVSEIELDDWQKELSAVSLSVSAENLYDSAENAKSHLSNFRTFLEKTGSNLVTGCALNDASLDTARTNIASARNSVDTAVSNLSAAEEELRTAESDLWVNQKELELKQAGATTEQIAGQKAKIKSAEADIQNIKAQIAKTTIFSPINGVIVKQDAKIGEIVAANAPLVSVISDTNFEIETNIPEVDIAKVKIGDSAKITLDAYGNDVVFGAEVISIEPAETIIEGVATYKTKLQFLEEDGRIKSGMTANIDILTAKTENAISIPQRAVKTDGEKTVKMLDKNNIAKEVIVEIGLKGSDGNVEIKKGINEGDKVIISEQQ